jgi:CDP-glycerol glycerophosphotransferase
MGAMAPPDPTITIVLIAYNDARNLPAAAESALAQTFSDIEVVIVDDGSDDGTGEVAERFAAGDERVRVVHLAVNSGGCSAPRNAGIDTARGEWIMFLDSDDLYEPGACEALVGAARRHDADVVSGAMLRIDVVQQRERRKFGWMYQAERVFEGLREWPEVLFDVMVQNKIFRRSLLDDHAIRFPAGLIYEDMDFTARAYARSRRAVVVPDVVYRYLQRDAAEHAAITGRTDVAAFRDRITIQRMMDEFLLAEGLPEAKLVKDVRFLQFDLRDQLQGLPRAGPAERETVVRMAREYFDELDQRAFRRVRPTQRLVARLVGRGDVRGLVRLLRVRSSAAGAVRRGIDVLPAPVVDRLGAPGGARGRPGYAPPPGADHG